MSEPNLKLKEYVDSFVFAYSHLLKPLCSQEVIKLMACQSALETAYGTSAICKENCNLFGMKFPKIRATVAEEVNRGHAKYRCYSDSVMDLILWLLYNKATKSEMDSTIGYLSILSRGKFNVTPYTYEKTLKIMLNQIH